MQTQTLSTKKGFTLLETIVTMALTVLVVTFVVTTMTVGLQTIREAHERERLHAHALTFSEAFQYWVRRGETLNLVTATELQITLPDTTVKTFTTAGDQLFLDAANLTPGTIRVQSVVFSTVSDSATVEFTLYSTEGSETFSGQTTASMRY